MSLKDKIFAFDIDGTLARWDGNVSDYSINEIRRLIDEGYNITLVTGRNILSCINIYRKCNMKIAAVMCNGAIVYDPTNNKKILDITIPLKDVFAYMKDENFMKNVDDVLIEIDETSYSLTGKRWGNADFVGDFKETLPCAPNSMVISVYSPELQQNIKDIVNASENYRYRSWMLCGEFYGAHFSKREGVIELLKYHNKTKDDLIFFGDAENDREILEYAGYGIAMQNADDETKKLAKEVTELNNENDGAIKHLLKMIEENK